MSETPCESHKQSRCRKVTHNYGHPRKVKDCGRNASHEMQKGQDINKGLLKGLKAGERLMNPSIRILLEGKAQTTPRAKWRSSTSACRGVAQNVLDIADIVRDGDFTSNYGDALVG